MAKYQVKDIWEENKVLWIWYGERQVKVICKLRDIRPRDLPYIDELKEEYHFYEDKLKSITIIDNTDFSINNCNTCDLDYWVVPNYQVRKTLQ